MTIARAFCALLLAVLVALPLASWAAARAPIVGAVSLTLPHHRTTIPCVHRRAHRHRRNGLSRRAGASRAFASSVPVPELRLVSAVVSRTTAPASSDLPPPDFPPV